jgi:hypothetical protein
MQTPLLSPTGDVRLEADKVLASFRKVKTGRSVTHLGREHLHLQSLLYVAQS